MDRRLSLRATLLGTVAAVFVLVVVVGVVSLARMAAIPADTDPLAPAVAPGVAAVAEGRRETRTLAEQELAAVRATDASARNLMIGIVVAAGALGLGVVLLLAPRRGRPPGGCPYPRKAGSPRCGGRRARAGSAV